jgi:hypothetical protein
MDALHQQLENGLAEHWMLAGHVQHALWQFAAAVRDAMNHYFVYGIHAIVMWEVHDNA